MLLAWVRVGVRSRTEVREVSAKWMERCRFPEKVSSESVEAGCSRVNSRIFHQGSLWILDCWYWIYFGKFGYHSSEWPPDRPGYRGRRGTLGFSRSLLHVLIPLLIYSYHNRKTSVNLIVNICQIEDSSVLFGAAAYFNLLGNTHAVLHLSLMCGRLIWPEVLQQKQQHVVFNWGKIRIWIYQSAAALEFQVMANMYYTRRDDEHDNIYYVPAFSDFFDYNQYT